MDNFRRAFGLDMPSRLPPSLPEGDAPTVDDPPMPGAFPHAPQPGYKIKALRDRPASPRFNLLYDSVKSGGNWHRVIDFVIEGNFTAVNGTPVRTALLASSVFGVQGMNSGSLSGIGQYPKAPYLYLCVRHFSMAGRAGTQTGTMVMHYEDYQGKVAPFGVISGATNLNIHEAYLMPSPITDSDQANYGNLYALLAGATPDTWDFQIGFSVVYCLPTLEAHTQGELTGVRDHAGHWEHAE